MAYSKFSDLHDRSIDGSPIRSVCEKQTGGIQTVYGLWFLFSNLTEVYPQLDARR